MIFTGPTKQATLVYSLVYSLDAAGRTTGVGSRVGTLTPYVVASSMVYDAADRLTSARYGNGHQTYWTYNPLSERLDRIEYRNGSGGIHSAVSYGYDANSNIIREDRYKLNVAGVWRQKLHDFDALDRLQVTSFQTSSGTTAQSFTYTGSGNIQQAGYQAYSYDSPTSSQAASLIEDSATGSQRTLVYDEDGYLANDRTINADGSRSNRTFAFDPMGCMRSIRRDELSPFGELTSSARSDYTCGLGGQVVARSTTLPTGAMSRRIDFAGLAEIRPDDGIFLLRIPVGGTVTYEDARSLPTGDSVSAHQMYMVSDIRGSLIAATSWAGGQTDVTREAEFDAWGQKLTNYTALSSPKHGFDGAEADAAVGTYSFGARTYDPSLRRWVSPDPLIAAAPSFDEDLGNDLNLYAFAGNNPVARVDRSGFFGEDLAEMLQGSRAAHAVAGFVYGFTQGITPGGTFLPSPARDAPHGAEFQHWQGAGQVFGGGVGVVVHGTRGTAALAAEGPSLGSSTAVVAVSAVGVANAVAAISTGTKNIAEAQARGSESSGPARTPKSASGSGTKADASTRPKAPETGGGKTGRKVSRDARESGQGRLDDARKRLNEARSKPNKTPADKKAIQKLEGEVKQAEKRLRGSEEHARKQQGPSR